METSGTQEEARRRWTQEAAGPLIALAVAAAIELLSRNGIVAFPNPSPVFLAIVAFAGFSGGIGSGLASAGVVVLYSGYALAAPEQFLHYEIDDGLRLAFVVLAAPCIALFTGILKQRVEHALAQELESERRRRAEGEGTQRRLRKLAERLERALHGSLLALWEWDARTGLVYLDPEWAEIVGGKRALRTARLEDLVERIHPDDKAAVVAAFRATVDGGGDQYDVEHRVQAENGEWKWIHSIGRVTERSREGRVLTMFGTNRDITRRKLADLALRESESELRLITNAVPAMIAYLDANQRYLFCNRPYCEAIELPEKTILGRSLREIIGDATYRVVQPWVERALSGDSVSYERRQQPSDGSIRDLAVSYVPHKDENGRVNGFYALLIDVTEARRVERMKSEFVSMVSHELRTPLTSILGSLDTVSSGAAGKLPKEAKGMLDIAYRNSERLLRLTDEILDIEKIDLGALAMRPRQIDLARVLDQSLEANRGFAEKFGVRLQVTSRTGALVHADPDRLMQVMANLISNAVKFSPKGEAVELRLELEDAAAKVSVSDRGPGISNEFRDRIFGRFEQADSSERRQKGGSGLGLAICKEIVEKSGGTIGFTSAPGQGTTFHFRLPLSAPVA